MLPGALPRAGGSRLIKGCAGQNRVSMPIVMALLDLRRLCGRSRQPRHRGDLDQAMLLENWLSTILSELADRILAFDAEAAQPGGRLRVPDPTPALDKQIAAMALVNDLTVVTRHPAEFERTGLDLINPFRTIWRETQAATGSIKSGPTCRPVPIPSEPSQAVGVERRLVGFAPHFGQCKYWRSAETRR